MNTDTARLMRFAGIAAAVEGKLDGFGSELSGSRELDIIREEFLRQMDAGETPYRAFCAALDGVMAEATLAVRVKP